MGEDPIRDGINPEVAGSQDGPPATVFGEPHAHEPLHEVLIDLVHVGALTAATAATVGLRCGGGVNGGVVEQRANVTAVTHPPNWSVGVAEARHCYIAAKNTVVGAVLGHHDLKVKVLRFLVGAAEQHDRGRIKRQLERSTITELDGVVADVPETVVAVPSSGVNRREGKEGNRRGCKAQERPRGRGSGRKRRDTDG